MEQRISNYIVSKLDQEGGNMKAYNILINIALDLILISKTEEQIKQRIDFLLSNPTLREI